VTEQEGLQDEVAQAWLLRHDPAQLRDRNCENPPCGGGDGAQKGALSSEHADLAEKFRRTIAGDDTCPWIAVTLDDVGRARKQRDQVVGLVSVGEQHIPSGHVAFAAVPAQYSKLGRIQDRRTPRKRDEAIVAAVGRLRGSSRSSASQAGCCLAHRNLLADGRGYEDSRGPGRSGCCHCLDHPKPAGRLRSCFGSKLVPTRSDRPNDVDPQGPGQPRHPLGCCIRPSRKDACLAPASREARNPRIHA
jgi:hypothetical protein